jgi:hypothetical protein
VVVITYAVSLAHLEYNAIVLARFLTQLLEQLHELIKLGVLPFVLAKTIYSNSLSRNLTRRVRT